MKERVVSILLVMLVAVGATARAEDSPRLSRDEIALLVESERNYSSDEVVELLTMVITIADEELAREEGGRLAAETRVMEQETIIDRLRYRSRVSNVVWGIVGAAVGVTVTAVVF